MTDVSKIGVFGTSGYGKTTLTQKLLEERQRVIVFDPLDDYGKVPGYRSFEDPAGLQRAAAAAWSGSFKLAYVPPAEQEPESLHALCVFLRACQEPYKAGRDDRTITLVTEEMDMSYPVTALPGELTGMGFLCNRGRHYGIELIGVSQFPAQISTRFRANMPEVYSFLLPFSGHRDALKMQFGPDVIKLGQLPKHHYLHFSNGVVSTGQNGAEK